jgi:PAT family beta-lactamase induction signal transducer AmpG
MYNSALHAPVAAEPSSVNVRPTSSDKPTLARAIAFALSSRRTLAVTLLSFSSGLPLGLVWIAIPDWMRSNGIDIRIVGLTTLAHAPWTFKMLWSPLMDRYPLPWLGRRRGWIALCQIVLSILTFFVAGLASLPDAPWVILALCLAIAIAAASQDIVIDAYAVDVLHPEEQGVAVGARMAVYRVAMLVAGGLSITLREWIPWPQVVAGLALLYLPMFYVTRMAPEPEGEIPTPPTLRDAVWLPFLGFLSRHRAIEMLVFVLLYKLADNLAEALLRPFLVDMGYGGLARGIGLTLVGTTMTLVGAFLGGALTTSWGLGHCLWFFGLLQIFSNLGYILVARSDVNLPLMYGAMSFENVTKGMGMGAFGVLLLRMTQRRFSATQYALFSSMFGLPRLVAGPVAGFMVHAMGWTPFFWFTMVMGIPGLLMLARFVPLGTREPTFAVEPSRPGEPLSSAALTLRGLGGGLVGALIALSIMAAVSGLDGLGDGRAFDLLGPARSILVPTSIVAAVELLGCLVFGAVCGLLTAAVAAARHGALPPDLHRD